MNRYEPMPASLRLAAVIAALLLTVATLAISIYVPATLSPLGPETSVLATATAPPTEAANAPTSIEVVGHRETAVAAAPERLAER